MMLLARFLPLLPFVWGHGGMVWPPIWQNSHPIPLEDMWTDKVSSKPMVVDPRSGTNITELLWLTDEAFLGGVGQSYKGTGGPVTNDECEGRYERKCGKWSKTPWASPGRAQSLGGGCGIYGGHPNGCWEGDVGSTHKTASIDLQSECGIEGPPSKDRIVGGFEAEPNQWPWQVALFVDNAWFCGGS